MGRAVYVAAVYSSLAATVFLLSACIGRGTDEASVYGLRPRFEQRDIGFEELKARVLGPACIRCHAWAESESSLSRFVVPGDLLRSEVYLRVREGVREGRMPKDAPPLSSDQVAMVRAYIETLSRRGTPIPQPSPTPALEPTYRSLKHHLFDVSCLSCHHATVRRIPPLATLEDVRLRAEDIWMTLDFASMPPEDATVPMPTGEVIQTYKAWMDAGMPE